MKINNTLPGPGSYDNNSNIFKERQPAYKLGSQPRFKDKNDLKPGPGDYDYHSTDRSP